MPRKTFEAGMEAGAKPFEEKFKKQAEAIEKVGTRIDQRLDNISGIMDVVLDDMSALERKNVYSLNSIVDIADLDRTEKEFLCAVLYAIADLNESILPIQKKYLRSVKSYLMVSNIQDEIDLEAIENIESVSTQKAILSTIMEFLFLEYKSHDYMDDYEDVFDHFSVNRKGIRELQTSIDNIYEKMGIEGISEHYSFLSDGGKNSDNLPEAKEESMLERAEQAYLKYNIKEAYSLFTYLAEQGFGRAMYFLGEIYTNGYSAIVKKDRAIAKEWREKGREAGDVLCYLNCAFSSTDEEEKRVIFANSFEKVLALAQQGDIFAMNELADMFGAGYGTKQDESKRDFWLNESANAGYWRSINKLGDIAYNRKDFPTACTYYERASDIGYELASCNLANLYYNGSGVKQNRPIAFELYHKAARLGNSFAQLRVGSAFDFLSDSFGIQQNYNKARVWYERAAESGEGAAYYNLAFDYNSYYGLDMNHGKTVLLLKGAELGHERSIIESAKEICTGNFPRNMLDEFGDNTTRMTDFAGNAKTVVGIYAGIAADVVSAFASSDDRERYIKDKYRKVLEEYANNGNKTAQYYLGVLYTDKMYLGKDLSIAKKWLQMAANQGHSYAKDALDDLNGHGLLKSWIALHDFAF